MTKVKARYRAYSSTANLGSGFDVIAVALDAYFDEALVEVKSPGTGQINVNYIGPYASEVRGIDLVKEIAKRLIKEYSLSVDLYVKLWKGIPVGKGLGSSGASIALIIRALNELLGLGLGIEDEVTLAGEGESLVAGSPHYDNVSASLLGGAVIVLKESNDRVKPIKIDVSSLKGLKFIIVVPNVEVHQFKTGFMRSILPREVPLELVVKNSSRLATLILGLMKSDLTLIGKGLEDFIITPARSKYVPCYWHVKERVLGSGALGVTLSGAGPSIVVVAPSDKLDEVSRVIKSSYSDCGIDVEIKYSSIAPGVKRIE